MARILRSILVLPPFLAVFIQYRLSTTGVSPVSAPFPPLPLFPTGSTINNITDKVELVGENELVGPESLISANGFLFATLGDGRIARIAQNEGKGSVTWDFLGRTGDQPTDGKCGFSPSDEARTEEICGRPLGMKIVSRSSVDPNFHGDDEDILLVTDAYRGLIMITHIFSRNANEAEMIILATRATSDDENYHFRLLNALVQDPRDGSIYITETTQAFNRRRIFHAAFDGHASGRLLRYTKEDGVQVVVDDLYMANGIALSHSGQELLIVCGVQVRIYSLIEKRLVSAFVSTLPGTGDNIDAMTHTPDGQNRNCYWLGLGSKYAEPFSLLNFVSEKSWLKAVLVALVPYKTIVDLIPKLSALAVYDEDGALIQLYQDDSKIYPWVSEGEIFHGYFYLGSWHNPSLARVKL